MSKSSSNSIKRGFDSASSRNQSGNGNSLQPPQTPTVQTKAKNFLKQGLDKLNQGDYPGALENFKQA
ncbi:MAG TPA: hypothetical protein V6D30_08310, partial [Leptolyngbyaceae cyanobacterium]